jgi:uncharacterized protein involved in exopolysaccharide biosynthesis
MIGHHHGEPSEPHSLWQGSVASNEVSRNLRRLKIIAKKRVLYVFAWTACLVAAGLFYSAVLRPEYVSTVQILLQPRRVINDGPEDARHYHQFVLDNQQCETELALVTSQQLLRTVYRALDIRESPEVKNQFDSLSSSLRALIMPPSVTTATPVDDYSYWRFTRRIRARRTGLSYVLNITYRAYDPAQASRVVGSVANAYIASRLRSIGTHYRESGPYLERRVALHRQQLAAAEEGIRTGKISEKDFQELDVRILGQPDTSLGPVYPRRTPLLITLVTLGLVSGTLLVLFRSRRPSQEHNNLAPVY